jgi:hypothetical protein
MPDASYGSLPFQEQIAFFRRKFNINTNAWTDIWQEAHDHAFVVAGANRDDLVADFRAAVDKAIANGGTLEQFRQDFDRIVAKYGWSYNGGRNWRSRVIYETNLRTSYAAGRYAQLQEVKRFRPYWLYVHSDSVQHPRPLHKQWGDAKLVLHADDPWWQTHYPPNGWGCQCTVHALNDRDLKRMGKDGPDKAPPIDMQTVTVGERGPTPRTVQTPAGVDPGFGYVPGRDAWLREQATRAAQAAGADDRVWESLLRTTFADVGRPVEVPALPAPADLGPRLASAEETIATIRRLIGGDVQTFDMRGLPVIVDAELLGQHVAEDLGRTPYLTLLPDLLSDPWEVWYALEREANTGAIRTRVRSIKRYDIGRGRSVLLVANEIDGALIGWTFVPVRQANYINNQRTGLLWYASAEQ